MFTKMNPEIKQLWLNALRGGEYEQGHGYLRRNKAEQDSFCCLGVLCDLAEQAGVIGEPEESDWSGGETYIYRDDYEGEETILPEGVARWAGLLVEREDGSFGPNKAGRMNDYVVVESDYGTEEGYLTLWELNDSAGHTFADLANVIEEQF